MKTPTERFLWLYDELLARGLARNARDIAEKSGMSPGNITNIRKGRNNLGSNDADKFLTAFPQINRQWFISGKGDPFIKMDKGNEEFAILQAILAKYGLKSLGEQIRELKQLQDEGLITAAEFRDGKRKILR